MAISLNMDDPIASKAFVYEKKTLCGELCKGLFSHFGLFLMVAAYTCFGAWVFVQLESTAELERYAMKKKVATAIEQDINYTVGMLWFYGDSTKFNWTKPSYSKKVGEHLDMLEERILHAIEDTNYDGTVDTWTYDWTFVNSLLLCMTIITTIGYGHITPVTLEGQLFCIFYSLVGCALFLVFLANLGDLMAKGFTLVYSRGCCRWFRSRRYEEEIPVGVSKRYANLVMDDKVGDEEYMPTSEVVVPITLNVVVLHAYILLGGILFCEWEGWSLVASFYFTFVTLSTIGYGDLVPGNALLDGDTTVAQLKMLFTVGYIVLGMALLSMCINLMKEQIVEKVKWAGKELGCVKSSSNEVKADAIRKQSLIPKSADRSPYRQPGYNDYPIESQRDEILPGTFMD